MCAANSRHVRAALASSLLLSCSKMSSLHSAGRASHPLPGTSRRACDWLPQMHDRRLPRQPDVPCPIISLAATCAPCWPRMGSSLRHSRLGLISA